MCTNLIRIFNIAGSLAKNGGFLKVPCGANGYSECFPYLVSWPISIPAFVSASALF
jgi:hypothetical protein